MIFDKIKPLENELKGKFQTNSKYYSELQEVLYESIKEEIGFGVKKLYHDVFSSHNGFEINWKNDDLICGEINVLRIHHSFSSPLQEHYIHAFDEFGEDFKTFARQFYPFDIYRESLDEVTLTVVKIIDEEHLEFWIWNNEGSRSFGKPTKYEYLTYPDTKIKFIMKSANRTVIETEYQYGSGRKHQFVLKKDGENWKIDTKKYGFPNEKTWYKDEL